MQAERASLLGEYQACERLWRRWSFQSGFASVSRMRGQQFIYPRARSALTPQVAICHQFFKNSDRGSAQKAPYCLAKSRVAGSLHSWPETAIENCVAQFFTEPAGQSLVFRPFTEREFE